MLRPSTATSKEAGLLENKAFKICLRLGFIQARIWEVFDNAPIHAAPEEDVEPPIEFDDALDQLVSEMKVGGHILIKTIGATTLGYCANGAINSTSLLTSESGRSHVAQSRCHVN